MKAPQRSGFSLIELLVVISVVTLLVSIALPSLSNARRSATTQLCATHLRELSTAATSYSFDMRDRICSYSWRKGKPIADDVASDLLSIVDTAQDDFGMKSPEFTTIIRRLGNESDASTAPPLGPRFFPYHYYSTLPIKLYTSSEYSIRGSVCPADRVRLSWQNQDTLLSARESATNEPSSGDRQTSYRIKYSSSYTLTSSAYQPDVGRQVIIPGSTYRFSAQSASLNLDSRRMGDVAFPSQKAFIFDTIDRHSTRQHVFFAEQGSNQPVVMFDGSVQSRKFDSANGTSHPYFPQGILGQPVPLFLAYRPAAIYQEPKRLAPEGPDLDARYWFTSAGLKGVDFGGARVETSMMQGP